MLYAKFINFTKKPFTAYWDGKPYTFKPGQERAHLPDGVAQVFAKHLANKVLTESKKEQYCSPKKPMEVPEFMDIVNKAYFPEGTTTELDPEIGIEPDKQISMNVEVKKREPVDPYNARENQSVGPGQGAQIVEVEEDKTVEENGYQAPVENNNVK